jgi:hypothetical protein
MKKDEVCKYVTRIKELRNACKIPVGQYNGKGQLGKTRYKWEDNIKSVYKK